MPHSVESPVLKLVYELFAEHKRFKLVARLLNEAGHRTRKGKKFTDTALKRFVEDPTAKGIHRANYWTVEDGKLSVKPEKDWVFNKVDAVVSEELWNRCNGIIGNRKYGPHKIAKKTIHLFAGVAHCICGHKMYVPANTPKYVCQKCRNKIPIIDLEGVFHEQLKNFFISSEEVSKYLSDADKTLQHKEEVLEVLLREKLKIAQSMDRLFELYSDARMTAESFGTRYKPLEERSKQLDEEIPRLQAEADLLKISYLSKDEIFTNARNLYDRWPTLTHEEKRKITESLTHKITVGKGEIDIDLCYLPPSPSSENVSNGQRNVFDL